MASAADASSRSRTPHYEIECVTGATTNPYGLRQSYLDDPETFINTELARAITLGYSKVTIRNPGGKKYGNSSAFYDLSGPLDWPEPVRTFFQTRFAQMCLDRLLTAWVYGGSCWPTPTTSSNDYPPIPDPALESDEIDRVVFADKDCGFEGRFFDAVANTTDTYTSNRTDDMNDLAGYLWDVHAYRTGIEAVPVQGDGLTLDTTRSPYFENYVFADYLFGTGGDFLSGIRPPYTIPVTVQARVVMRSSDTGNALIMAYGSIQACASALSAAGWIVHADNSISLSDGTAIADIAQPPGTEPSTPTERPLRPRMERLYRTVRG